MTADANLLPLPRRDVDVAAVRTGAFTPACLEGRHQGSWGGCINCECGCHRPLLPEPLRLAAVDLERLRTALRLDDDCERERVVDRLDHQRRAFDAVEDCLRRITDHLVAQATAAPVVRGEGRR